MAEAIAAVSLVANIIQLVQFGELVLGRLNDYQSRVGELPEAFKHINNELPALLYKLRETKTAANSGAFTDEKEKASMAVVHACTEQILDLEELLIKALPKIGDSGTKRRFKAVKSLGYDSKVEKKVQVIRNYVATLTYLDTGTAQSIRMFSCSMFNLMSTFHSSKIELTRSSQLHRLLLQARHAISIETLISLSAQCSPNLNQISMPD
jgi:hypothetical protein